MSIMSAPTPGPWDTDGQSLGWHGGQVAAVAVWKHHKHKGTPVAWVHPYGYGFPLGDAAADARLIALAPQLRDALRHVQEMYLMSKGPEMAELIDIDRINALLAQLDAEGGHP